MVVYLSTAQKLTSLWGPDADHIVGPVQLTEALSEHLHLVGGVWF